MSKRTRIGVTVSIVYAVAYLAYVLLVEKSRQKLFELEPNNLGDMLAGLAAPLALFWLVIGYFQQGEELELQRKELELQRNEVAKLTIESARQAKAIEANELHARRDTFFRQAEFTMAELDALSFSLLNKLNRPPFALEIRAIAEERARGNSQKYFEQIIGMIREARDATRNTLADHCATGLQRYFNLCEHLIQSANITDPNGDLRFLFQGTKAFGLYEEFCGLMGRPSVFAIG